MNLGQAINEIYPLLDPASDFMIQVDGEGNQYIAEWNNPNPIPTQSELEAAWFRVVKKLKKGEFSGKAISSMKVLFPEVNSSDAIWLATILALSNSTDPRLGNLKSTRDKLFRGIDRVDAETTEAGVNALVWEDM